MGRGPKQARAGRAVSGSVSDGLVREVAARVEAYGQARPITTHNWKLQKLHSPFCCC